MNRSYYILLALCFTFFAHPGRAQDKTGSSKNVVIYTDPRLAVVLKKHRAVAAQQEPGVIRSGRGYRVQIYNGNDRSKANSVKIDFMRRFPGVRSYLTYVSPHFRVKVGDYLSRHDAQKMYHEVSRIYNPCMIVPDYIVINTVKNTENNNDQ